VGSGSACGGEMGQRGHEADGGAAEEGRAGNTRLEKLADEYTVVGLDMHTDIQVHMCSLRMVEQDHGQVVLGLGRGFNKFLMRLFASARFPGKCFLWEQQLACGICFRAFLPFERYNKRPSSIDEIVVHFNDHCFKYDFKFQVLQVQVKISKS
jgi:hypothetical protein